MDVPTALTRLGGVSDRAALVELVSRTALEQAVRRGEVRRPQRNVYVLPDADRASVAAHQAGGVVSHLSAALAWGWKVKHPPARPWVTVPRNRHPRPIEGVELRFASLTAADCYDNRTSRVRTVIDCARALPFDEALSVADSAVRSGTVSREELLEGVERSPRTGRNRARRVVELASPRAANPFESVLRAIATDVPGLTPVPQGEIPGIGHADVTDAQLQIAIEAESFAYHALEEAFRYDIRRYTAMIRAGWLVARFVWEDVMRRQAYVRAVLADVVALRTQQQAVRRRTRRPGAR